MTRNQRILAGTLVTVVVAVTLVIGTNPWLLAPGEGSSDFPDFITSNEDYFVTRIGAVPEINRDTYQLEIKGLIENPTSFSLDELQSLNLTELPLTIECIGNSKMENLYLLLSGQVSICLIYWRLWVSQKMQQESSI
jgi:DMSO/TMAO reductase YedYZ molybdopterin-dependent catalytic subunit